MIPLNVLNDLAFLFILVFMNVVQQRRDWERVHIGSGCIMTALQEICYRTLVVLAVFAEACSHQLV